MPTTHDAAGGQTTSLLVERILTDNAAVLTTLDGITRFVVKVFYLHPDTPGWFDNGLAASAASVPIQDAEIPYLLGVAKVVQASRFTILVMLTELIAPGTTVAPFMYEVHAKNDTTDDDELALLALLRDSGTAAVDALHERCVIHNDLAGMTLVVCEEEARAERLVVVDFDCAMGLGST